MRLPIQLDHLRLDLSFLYSSFAVAQAVMATVNKVIHRPGVCRNQLNPLFPILESLFYYKLGSDFKCPQPERVFHEICGGAT